MLQLFLLFVVAVSAQTAPKVATYKGYEFSFYTNEASGKLTYDDAKQVCVDAGARLAEIKSADVQDFITTQLTDLGLVENWSSWAQGYWIGGVCGGGKDNWKWEDGTSIGNGTYQNWFNVASCSLLEPNSNKESDRICLFRFEEGKYNFNTCNETLGKWGDVDKKSNMNWICMKAATCLNRTVTPTRDTWALEYTGQLYSIHFCTTGEPTMLTWNFHDSSGANIATIEFAADVSTTPPTPCQPPSNIPTGYNATCQYNAGCFTTTFSVEAVLSASFNHSRLNLSQEGEICF
uniref:C-type lectin domain-containing protein n=1 Tax=Ciona savignyi TaxID=51511 RepID=H2Y4E4_CIOSA